MSNTENSVVRSLHFSVFHKRFIISGPHLSTFLYLPDRNQSKCHVSKYGIYWGNENSCLIPHCSANLSFLQFCLCSNVCINLGPLQWKREILDLPLKLLLFYWIKFSEYSLHLYIHYRVRGHISLFVSTLSWCHEVFCYSRCKDGEILKYTTYQI